MKKISNEEVNQYKFYMLNTVAGFCEDHEIDYYLAGPTLLAAVQYGGFMPWGNEIEVMMPRSSYNRFHESVKMYDFPEYYRFEGFIVDEGLIPYTKMIDTRFKEEFAIKILPIDGIPENQKKCLKHFEKIEKIQEKILKGKTFFDRTSPEVLVEKLEELANAYSFENEKYVAVVIAGRENCVRVLKDAFTPRADLDFCREKMRVPYNYKEYLEGLYGDYMSLQLTLDNEDCEYHILEK